MALLKAKDFNLGESWDEALEKIQGAEKFPRWSVFEKTCENCSDGEEVWEDLKIKSIPNHKRIQAELVSSILLQKGICLPSSHLSVAFIIMDNEFNKHQFELPLDLAEQLAPPYDQEFLTEFGKVQEKYRKAITGIPASYFKGALAERRHKWIEDNLKSNAQDVASLLLNLDAEQELMKSFHGLTDIIRLIGDAQPSPTSDGRSAAVAVTGSGSESKQEGVEANRTLSSSKPLSSQVTEGGSSTIQNTQQPRVLPTKLDIEARFSGLPDKLFKLNRNSAFIVAETAAKNPLMENYKLLNPTGYKDTMQQVLNTLMKKDSFFTDSVKEAWEWITRLRADVFEDESKASRLEECWEQLQENDSSFIETALEMRRAQQIVTSTGGVGSAVEEIDDQTKGRLIKRAVVLLKGQDLSKDEVWADALVWNNDDGDGEECGNLGRLLGDPNFRKEVDEQLQAQNLHTQATIGDVGDIGDGGSSPLASPPPANPGQVVVQQVLPSTP